MRSVAGGWFFAALAAAAPLAAQDEAARLANRAAQDRDIVYSLQEPETHAFALHHDYTEAKEGMDRYVNVVRKGSKASGPSAVLLDPDSLRKWSTKHHGSVLPIVVAFTQRTPLFVFAGDVGTGRRPRPRAEPCCL